MAQPTGCRIGTSRRHERFPISYFLGIAERAKAKEGAAGTP